MHLGKVAMVYGFTIHSWSKFNQNDTQFSSSSLEKEGSLQHCFASEKTHVLIVNPQKASFVRFGGLSQNKAKNIEITLVYS